MLHADLLPIELSNANTGQTRSHHAAHRTRQRIHHHLTTLGYAREPFAVPTGVIVTRVLGPGDRLWDASSVLRGSWKQLEDSLVELGWWVDDGPRYIRWVVGTQRADMRDQGPATMIQVFAYDDPQAIRTLSEFLCGPLASANEKSGSDVA